MLIVIKSTVLTKELLVAKEKKMMDFGVKILLTLVFKKTYNLSKNLIIAKSAKKELLGSESDEFSKKIVKAGKGLLVAKVKICSMH